MEREPSPSDLSDEEWDLISGMFSRSEKRGRQPTDDLRQILNGCFSGVRGGMAWRMMPHALPRGRRVYDHFTAGRQSGKWERINAALRRKPRDEIGRHPEPSAAVIDSPSVTTTEAGGPRGGACPRTGRRPDPWDGGKKVMGRKRQILVETEATVLKTKVHPAKLHDKQGGLLLLAGRHLVFATLRLVWAETHDQGLKSWARETLGWTIEGVKHWWTGVKRFWCGPGQQPPQIPAGFHGLPRRWGVERTLPWLCRHRRLTKDDEKVPETSETFIYMASSRTLLERLAKSSANFPEIITAF
jgi:putative transposase